MFVFVEDSGLVSCGEPPACCLGGDLGMGAVGLDFMVSSFTPSVIKSGLLVSRDTETEGRRHMRAFSL